MDVFTLYVGQGNLSATRSGNEAIVIDAHMPNAEDVSRIQIKESLHEYLNGHQVRGLILTGLDKDHACPSGVESILQDYQPDWIMYPKYYKDTYAADDVFRIIDKEEKRRARTQHPLVRKSVRVDRPDLRALNELATQFSLELFSPHMEDMDCSNNSSIVLKITGMDQEGFRYLITGDTETERWEGINDYFSRYLSADVIAAPHHGSRTGVNAQTLIQVDPDTVIISAGVGNCYGHPDAAAMAAYLKAAKRVYCTNASPSGTCFLTRKAKGKIETFAVSHPEFSAAIS
jgi:beta-lactamase superfamily II metal-dependent hydrolase